MATQNLTAEQTLKLNRAFGMLQQGNADDALTLARGVATQAPRSPDVHHLLALCRKALGQQEDAETSFRRALELAPRNAEILVNYANFLQRLRRPEEALQLLRRATGAAPTFARGWISLGLAALAVDRTEEARDTLERAVSLAPASGSAWHALGRARRAGGDLAGAEAALQRTVELEPRNGTAWINLSVVVKLLGRPAEALTFADNARRAGFSGPELRDAECGALVDLGRIEEALAAVRGLTRAAPRYTPAHVTLAHLLWEHGQALAPDEDPLTAFREAALNQPENGALQLAYIRFLLEADRAEEAVERVRALRATSSAPALTIVEANALDALGQLEEARPLYDHVYTAMAVRDPAFLNSYTRHLLRTGRPDAAAARALEVTGADPANQEAWGYLATAWRLIDDPREFWLCDYDRAIALVEVEPPGAYAGPADFLATLKATLDDLHKARREPVNQSLRGGSQTPGRLFGRPDPVIDDAQAAISRAVERHIAALPDDAGHPFLARKKRSVYFIGSWSVKLWSAGRHINHFHPQGWMSSAYYVSLPSSMTAQTTDTDRSGWIQFGQPPEDLGLDLAPRRYIRPKAGWVALFPSYMWHGTVPFEDDEPRITIAFDMTPAD